MLATPSGSNPSDYFSSQDSDFLDALAKTTLPGDIGFTEQQDHDQEDAEEIREFSPPPPNQMALKVSLKRKPEDDADVYGAARFGDFGQYMKRKRAKLQIQNKDIEGSGSLFHGISIYINGYTNPSIQVLRQLIVRHGGVFQPYLDKKAIVTHIVTNALTPAKIAEWKHMKVVRPEWLVDSADRGVLLPWRDYIWKPPNRSEPTQGAHSSQLSLNTVVPAPPTSNTAQSFNARSTSTSINPQEEHNLSTPSYAAHESNPNAQRAMHNPDWRAAHTSVAPDFIDGYYKNSRLHHLSAWKAELKELLREAQERAEVENEGDQTEQAVTIGEGLSMRGAGLVMRSPTKAKAHTTEFQFRNDVKGKGRALDPVEEQRVIMHCDFDCFFVAAGLTKRPELKGKPVVVCHSQGKQGGNASTSEIASASYEAREFGIRNGMSLQQAKKLCPGILTIPYEFELYKQFSLKFYTVLMRHADDLQAVSVDEALIDVTQAVNRFRRGPSHSKDQSKLDPVLLSYDPAKALAEEIRRQVREDTGCEISIGISHNISLARLATRRAKPAKSYHLVPGEVHAFIAPLDIADLHGFGRAAKQKALDKWGTSNLGDLQGKSKATLSTVLGKTTGETLYNLIRGVDERKLENDKERKSVSCDINYGIRFQTKEEVKVFLDQMAKEVSNRLDAIERCGRSITLKVMKRDPSAPVEPPKFLGHGICVLYNKQATFVGPRGRSIATNEAATIAEHAWKLLQTLDIDPQELRGLGIQIQKLEPLPESSSTKPQNRQNSDNQGHGQKGHKPSPFDRNVVGRGGNDMGIGSKPASNRAGERRSVGPTLGAKSTSSATGDVSETARGPDANVIDLPSFSQVDRSVFEALPRDIKQELENEYKRRSVSPFVAAGPPPPRPKDQVAPYRPFGAAKRNQPPAVSLFPRKASAGPDVRRITAQLDPRRTTSLSPRKSKYSRYAKLPGLASWKVPPSELLKLDIDPEVFAALPKNVQREQITAARMLQTLGYIPQRTDEERVELRPVEPDPGEVTYLPPPKARFIQPPTLKQAGPTRGEKLYFIDADDVQRVIEQWVTRFRLYPPNKQDIAFFAKWLVKCVDKAQAGDEGLLRAVAVMKWWQVLLKRWWGKYEYGFGYDGGEDLEEDKMAKIGQAWWAAFRDVKEQMDVVARRRFGGKLSLR